MKFVMIRVAMTSDRNCYSNKMTPLPTAITCSNIFWHRELFLQNRSRELFSPIRSPREVKAESVRASVIEIFWDEDFIVRKLIR